MLSFLIMPEGASAVQIGGEITRPEWFNEGLFMERIGHIYEAFELRVTVGSSFSIFLKAFPETPISSLETVRLTTKLQETVDVTQSELTERVPAFIYAIRMALFASIMSEQEGLTNRQILQRIIALHPYLATLFSGEFFLNIIVSIADEVSLRIVDEMEAT